MLQKLRQYSKSWLSGLFLGVLSLAFVSWGINDIFQGHVDTSVATVGKTEISQTEFQRDYNNYLKNLGYQRGTTITAEMARKEHIGDDLLQQTVLSTALDNVTRGLRLTADDATVTMRIRAMQQFAGLNGVFDHDTFQRIISQYNYTEKEFIGMMRNDFARAQLENAVGGNFVMPTGYVRALLAYSTELRAAAYVRVSPKLVTKVPAPTDAQLTAYVRAHAGSYSTPEYRDVTFARLGPEDVAGELHVTDAQINRAYENHKSAYQIAEKRTLERLSFQTEKDAKATAAELASGKSFAAVAKAHGFSKDDIALGDVTAADLDPEEAKLVFAAKEDGITAPVKSTFGWNIYHVAKIIPGSVTPLADVRDALTAEILGKLARAKLDDVANAYTDAISNGFTLKEAADKAGMTLSHVAAIDRDGLTPAGDKAKAPDDAEFRELVFKAEVGEEGDPVMTKGGALYVLMVNGVTPPKLKPLAQVRDKALAAWTADKKTELLKKEVADLTAAANKAKSLDGIARKLGVKVEHSEILTRQSSDSDFSPEMLQAVYDAAPGTAVFGTPAKGEGYIVARVTGVAHPLPPEKDARFARAAQMLSQATGSNVVSSLAYAARDEEGVEINRKLLDSVIGKGEGS